MARIREAEIAENGEVRIVRPKKGGMLGVMLALGLIAGGVWAFDTAYGASGFWIELSGAASN